MLTAMSCWPGSRLLTSGTLSILCPHRDSFWISCCCPESWKSYSYGSHGLVPAHDTVGHRGERYWSVPTQNSGCGPGCYQGSGPAPPWVWYRVGPALTVLQEVRDLVAVLLGLLEGQDQLSGAQAMGDSFPMAIGGNIGHRYPQRPWLQ